MNETHVDLLVRLRLCNSKSEARRCIAQGAVSVDGVRVNGLTNPISADTVKATLRVGNQTLDVVRFDDGCFYGAPPPAVSNGSSTYLTRDELLLLGEDRPCDPNVTPL